MSGTQAHFAICSVSDRQVLRIVKEAAIESFEKAIELGYKDSQEKLAELKKE